MLVAEPKAGKLFQEDLLEEPMWMLVACSLVNRTTWDQAKPAFLTIKKMYPTPKRLAEADPSTLEEPLRPLGLWRQRSRRLPLLAQRYLESPPASAEDVLKFPACGRYASDSWAIFVERRTDVQPTDGKLNWYLQQLNQRRLTMTETAMKITLSTDEATRDELLAIYNAEAKLRGQPELKTWKESKEKLAGRIAKLCADHALAPKVVQMPERPLMKIATQEEILAEVAAMPEIPGGLCIKDVACLLLTAVRCTDPDDNRVVGFSYASILHKIATMFPNSTTSNACLRWYLVRIRQEIEGFDKHKMPIRFKRPKTML